MCSRFTISRTRQELELLFGVPFGFDYVPRPHIAPTTLVPTLRVTATGREIVALRWGLIPTWADEASPLLINARAETAGSKPSFRAAAASRRCIVLADGFIEWETVGKKKYPFHFRLADGAVFGFAALWEPPAAAGKAPDQETVAILTVAAGPDVATIHDRMPAMLMPGEWDRWLNPEHEWKSVADMLQPQPAGTLTAIPLDTTPRQATLF